MINISALKDDYDYLRREAIAIREEASDKVIKAIIETAYLEDGEIAKAASLDELQMISLKHPQVSQVTAQELNTSRS